jgi:hypothetical protein
MKVLANGGLNVSELDGWWAEAYTPEVGWAFGDGKDRGNDPDWDAPEAGAMYSLLEREIVPALYDRDGEIPRQWVARTRESMALLTPAFSANRSERQYTDELYLPLASAYAARTRNRGAVAVDLLAWQRALETGWRNVRFGTPTVVTHDGHHCFRVELTLGAIHPADVQAELYADPVDGGHPFRAAMSPAGAVESEVSRTWLAPHLCRCSGDVVWNQMLVRSSCLCRLPRTSVKVSMPWPSTATTGLFAASAIQAAGLDVFSPLNHNGLYHLVSMLGVGFLYAGVLKLKTK